MFLQNELCLEIAQYFLDHKSTVRKTAQYFNISKSSVHNYLHKKLPLVNSLLFAQVQQILDTNSAEKHLRGGQATKIRYKKLKNKNN